MKSALITGITGQDGVYPAEFLQNRGYKVFGTISPRANPIRLSLLRHLVPSAEIVDMQLINDESIVRVIDQICPTEIYNLASVSSVSRSISEPELTHEDNGLGPIRIINAIRKFGSELDIRVFKASSSEMFGNSLETPQNESTPLRPISAYGISKAFAHEGLGEARKNGIFIVCGILFNHESPYRGEGFVSKKIRQGVEEISAGSKEKITLGSHQPERDWGFARDYVEAMWNVLQHDTPEDFVISTGISRSISEFLQTTLNLANLKGTFQDFVTQDQELFRPNELTRTVGDPTKIKQILHWNAKTSFEDMVSIMLESEFRKLTLKP